MKKTLPLLLLAANASSQPLTNPAIFGQRGHSMGGYVVGGVVGLLVFGGLKHAGEHYRWKTGKPGVEKAFVASGAIAALAVFCACAFAL